MAVACRHSINAFQVIQNRHYCACQPAFFHLSADMRQKHNYLHAVSAEFRSIFICRFCRRGKFQPCHTVRLYFFKRLLIKHAYNACFYAIAFNHGIRRKRCGNIAVCICNISRQKRKISGFGLTHNSREIIIESMVACTICGKPHNIHGFHSVQAVKAVRVDAAGEHIAAANNKRAFGISCRK